MIYDKDESKSTHSLTEVVNDSDYIFLSVPTPSNLDGTINLDIVNSALNDISQYDSDSIILLRSTFLPAAIPLPSIRAVPEGWSFLCL